jgi:hypothetical protein
MSSKCPNCGAPMVQMILSSVCQAECDLKIVKPERKIWTVGVDLPQSLAWNGSIDGYQLEPGDKFLVTFHDSPKDNGIYVAEPRDLMWERWHGKSIPPRQEALVIPKDTTGGTTVGFDIETLKQSSQRRLSYNKAARSLFPIQEMPEGALPLYLDQLFKEKP